MPLMSAETARCADCYAILFPDEMNRCPEGHWICPGCICDCAVLAEAKMQMALWAAWNEWQRPEAQSLWREGGF